MASDSGEKVIPVKVAVRSRPLLQWELNDGCKDCVDFIHEACQVFVELTIFIICSGIYTTFQHS